MTIISIDKFIKRDGLKWRLEYRERDQKEIKKEGVTGILMIKTQQLSKSMFLSKVTLTAYNPVSVTSRARVKAQCGFTAVLIQDLLHLTSNWWRKDTAVFSHCQTLSVGLGKNENSCYSRQFSESVPVQSDYIVWLLRLVVMCRCAWEML